MNDTRITDFWALNPHLQECMHDGRTSTQHACGLFKFDPHKYGCFYDHIFTPLKREPLALLEIGISGGWSLLLWDQYFTHKKRIIIGMDPLYAMCNKNLSENELKKAKKRVEMFENTTEPQFSDRVHCIFEDAYTRSAVERWENESFDVIMDDGSHHPADKAFVIREYWKKVKRGGWLIIEDHHWSRDDQVLREMFKLNDIEERIIYNGTPTHKMFRDMEPKEEGLICLKKQT